MKLKEKQAARDACVRGVPFNCGGHCILGIPFDDLSGEDCCYQCEMDSECKGDILEMCEYVNGFRGYDEFCFTIITQYSPWKKEKPISRNLTNMADTSKAHAMDANCQTAVFVKEIMRTARSRYRIVSKYPCYNGCIPFTGYFVQVLKEGTFKDKWVDIKGFDTLKRAKELLNALQGQGG